MHHNRGFTLVEVLVAIAVSSIALASLYVAYDIVEKRYMKLRETTVMGQTGRSVLRMIERDLRMAGFKYRDDTGVFLYGNIAGDAIVAVESGDVCCDQISIIYDQHDQVSGLTDRVSVSYSVETYTGSKGARNRLYKQTNILQPNSRIGPGPKEVMADYIEDLQFEASGAAVNPQSLMRIYLALRTKREYSREKAWQRNSYHAGNSTYSVTDGYRRREFGSTVAVRNLMF